MPLFTKENAKEFSRLGTAKRWENYRLRKAAELLPKPPPPPEPEPEQEIPATVPEVEERFPRSQLARVRRHVGRVNNLLDHEADPQKIDRLASAISKLCEVERILAGRPLPGSIKPRSGSSARRAQVAEPVAE